MVSIFLLSGILLAPASGAPVANAVVVKPKPEATMISTSSVTPATITFTATDPDTKPTVSGSAGATVKWSTTGSTMGSWNLKVSAPATFSSCATVPSSAVTVACGTVTGGSGGACGGNVNLSTTSTQIASGTEGSGSGNYSVSLTFTLADSWKYIASSSCSLSVTYTITAN